VNADDLRALVERVPFVPFRLHLSNGQWFDVQHPHFLWVFRNRLELAVPEAAAKGILEHAEHISLPHVARIEELAPVGAT
jgi:hypothetical protein